MRKYSIYYALLLMGATAIVAQILLIRELIITFSGNELTIGIFLANWLILEALGSYISGQLFRDSGSNLLIFTFLQGLLVIFLPVIIYFARISKSFLSLSPGEGSDIFTIFYISLILLTPIALIGGAQFSLGPGLIKELKQNPALSIGKTYLSESLGSIFGGLFATYLCLQYLDSIQSVFFVAALNILSGLFLLYFYGSNKSLAKKKLLWLIKTFHLLLVFLFFFILITGRLNKIHRQSLQKQWTNYNIVAYQNSIYGNVTLLERDQQLDLLSNGVPILSLPTPDLANIEELVHFPLSYHRDPKTIFLVGGGPCGVLDELIKYPLTKIDYTELDPTLIQIMEKNYVNMHPSVLNRKSLNVHYTDGRHFLITTGYKYDVIIVNVPDPSTLELNRFYTKEFFETCLDHLEKNGLIIFQIPGSAAYMNPHLSRLHACLINTVNEVFEQHIIIPYEHVFILATNDKNVFQISSDSLYSRLNKRKIETSIFTKAYIKYKLDRSRLDWYQKELSQINVTSTNSDLKPVALFYDLLYWNSLHSPHLADFYLWLQNITGVSASIGIILFFLFIYLLKRFSSRSADLHLLASIFTSGFAGMGLSVVFVLTFQAFYGYVYLWIGLIITTFMAGLALGSFISIRYISQPRNLPPAFLKSEIGFVIYFTLLSLFILNIKHFYHSGLFLIIFQFFIVLFTVICGFLVGFQFPIAGKIQLSRDGIIAKTAGKMYAADLVGAWAGGIVVTLIFIPILGIIETCFLILILKCGSTLVFRFSEKN